MLTLLYSTGPLVWEDFLSIPILAYPLDPPLHTPENSTSNNLFLGVHLNTPEPKKLESKTS